MWTAFHPAYAPPSTGKQLLVFIDDMNMPQVDTYGTQQPIALLKLLLEKGGMFDRGKDLNWKMFKDVQFIAAMGKVHGYIPTILLQYTYNTATIYLQYCYNTTGILLFIIMLNRMYKRIIILCTYIHVYTYSYLCEKVYNYGCMYMYVYLHL